MDDAEKRYEYALGRLAAAERAYGNAESELIHARREVREAERHTKWYKKLHSLTDH